MLNLMIGQMQGLDMNHRAMRLSGKDYPVAPGVGVQQRWLGRTVAAVYRAGDDERSITFVLHRPPCAVPGQIVEPRDVTGRARREGLPR
jgi:hypothetical protein